MSNAFQIMSRLQERLFHLTLFLIALYAVIAAVVPLFGYQFFIMPVKFEAIKNISFDYIRLLLLRSCIFFTMAIFLLDYALYRRPYSALAPVYVFCYSMSIFELLAVFSVQQITDYSASPYAVIFWLVVGGLAQYKNSKSANTIFRN